MNTKITLDLDWEKMTLKTEHSHLAARLQLELQKIIPNAELKIQALPHTKIDLYLIDDAIHHQPLDADVIQRIWQDTPYWVFCWASGLAMAQWLLQNPQHVADKTVIDFGAGSGVVGIAAKLVGAKQVICCDIDPISLMACRANALLNQVELSYADDLYQLKKVDVLLAGDVLYDQANRFFLDDFLNFADDVWVADSRVKNFVHERYQKLNELTATTVPDLDESLEFRNVNMYRSVP